MEANIAELVKAIKSKSCVLFIGPEITKMNGQDIQQVFYSKLDGALQQDAVYDNHEKLWNFKDSTVRGEIITKLSVFFDENPIQSNDLLKKAISIPFPLIISLLPDNTVEKEFKKNGFDCYFDYYKNDLEEKIVQIKNADKPLVYNLFGNIHITEYILSHANYFSFLKKLPASGCPQLFRDLFYSYNHFVFIGLEFDKWYNILLLYILLDVKSTIKNITFDKNPEFLKQKLKDCKLDVVYQTDNQKIIDDLYFEISKENLLRQQTKISQTGKLLEEKQKKLNYLEEEKLVASFEEKFQIRKKIEETQNEIAELIKQLEKESK